MVAGLLAACEAIHANSHQYGPAQDLLPTILDALEKTKATFYEQRLGRDLETHVAALGAFCKSALRHGESGATRAFLLDLFEAGDDDGEEVDREQARRLLAIADERGVLRKRTRARAGTFFELPAIPSMAAYLAAEFDAMAQGGNETALALAKRLHRP